MIKISYTELKNPCSKCNKSILNSIENLKFYCPNCGTLYLLEKPKKKPVFKLPKKPKKKRKPRKPRRSKSTEQKAKFNQKKSDKYSKQLKVKATKPELLLKKVFDDDRMVYKFQKTFFSDNFCYIVDFYFVNLHGTKYVIEIDGSSHDSDKAIRYDKKRTNILETKRKCNVIRFRNKDVFNRLDWVVDEIYSLLPKFK